ncbi:short chain dehydrogenase [compost metagenome]
MYKAVNLESVHAKQPGDPKKLAERVVDVVTGTGVAEGREMPFRLPLGTDAFSYILDKCDEVKKQIEPWEDVIKSTDF